MRKFLILISAIFMLITISGCTTQLDYTYYKGAYITVGIVETSDNEFDTLYYYEDLDNIIAPGIKNYSKDFFEENVLIIIKDYAASELTECKINEVSIKSNAINIDLTVTYNNEYTQGNKQCNFIFLELKCRTFNEVKITRTVNILNNN